MNMTPQAYPLVAHHDGETYYVIGWTADEYWTDDPDGRLHPVAVAANRSCRPQVLTGRVGYSRPVS